MPSKYFCGVLIIFCLPRSCGEENVKPVSVSGSCGEVPRWIRGSLVQNGPGKFSFGSSVFRQVQTCRHVSDV